MEPVRIFLTRPVKLKIYAGRWPVRSTFFFTEGLGLVFNTGYLMTNPVYTNFVTWGTEHLNFI